MRYFFNTKNGNCEVFEYGGCGGNTNRFLSHAECTSVCSCALTPETGPCRGNMWRWFYSPADGCCRPFIYGGCGGNTNNYPTWMECSKHCGFPNAGSNWWKWGAEWGSRRGNNSGGAQSSGQKPYKQNDFMRDWFLWMLLMGGEGMEMEELASMIAAGHMYNMTAGMSSQFGGGIGSSQLGLGGGSSLGGFDTMGLTKPGSFTPLGHVGSVGNLIKPPMGGDTWNHVHGEQWAKSRGFGGLGSQFGQGFGSWLSDIDGFGMNGNGLHGTAFDVFRIIAELSSGEISQQDLRAIALAFDAIDRNGQVNFDMLAQRLVGSLMSNSGRSNMAALGGVAELLGTLDLDGNINTNMFIKALAAAVQRGMQYKAGSIGSRTNLNQGMMGASGSGHSLNQGTTGSVSSPTSTNQRMTGFFSSNNRLNQGMTGVVDSGTGLNQGMMGSIGSTSGLTKGMTGPMGSSTGLNQDIIGSMGTKTQMNQGLAGSAGGRFGGTVRPAMRGSSISSQTGAPSTVGIIRQLQAGYLNPKDLDRLSKMFVAVDVNGVPNIRLLADQMMKSLMNPGSGVSLSDLRDIARSFNAFDMNGNINIDIFLKGLMSALSHLLPNGLPSVAQTSAVEMHNIFRRIHSGMMRHNDLVGLAIRYGAREPNGNIDIRLLARRMVASLQTPTTSRDASLLRVVAQSLGALDRNGNINVEMFVKGMVNALQSVVPGLPNSGWVIGAYSRPGMGGNTAGDFINIIGNMASGNPRLSDLQQLASRYGAVSSSGTVDIDKLAQIMVNSLMGSAKHSNLADLKRIAMSYGALDRNGNINMQRLMEGLMNMSNKGGSGSWRVYTSGSRKIGPFRRA